MLATLKLAVSVDFEFLGIIAEISFYFLINMQFPHIIHKIITQTRLYTQSTAKSNTWQVDAIEVSLLSCILLWKMS